MAEITDVQLMKPCALLLLLVMSFPVSSRCAKIMLVPANCNSHVAYFTRLAVELAAAGHVTKVLAPSNARTPDDLKASTNVNFSYISYPVDRSTSFMNSPEGSAAMMQMALAKSHLETISLFLKHSHTFADNQESDCIRLMENDALLDQIRSEGFQFAIMDPAAAIHCFYSLPYSMRIPYASLSVSFSSSFLFSVPRLPSFTSLLVPTDRLSFSQRLASLAMDLVQVVASNQSTLFVEKYAPDRTALTAAGLMRQSSLWFFLEDLAAGFPMPQMPNTVAVGDLMSGRPGRSLPPDLEEFVEASPAGVIVVSFGSLFDYVPGDIVTNFCSAFAEIHRRFGLRVVWKLKKGADACASSEEYIRMMPWIPQNDLLADRRVRLFVSHGGFNSIIESVYHAKPLIVIPIAMDQPLNAAVAEFRGYAIRMDLLDFTAERFIENVERMLVRESANFTRNVQLASALLRDKPDTPAERVSRMIEHVIKYGDRHLRTGAFDLNVFELWMFDLFAVFICFGLVLATVATTIVICVCQRLVKRLRGKAVSKSKKA